MAEPQNDPAPEAPKTYSAQDVRQGQIILRKRWQRWVFFGGLAALVLFVLLIRIAGAA